MSCHDPAAPPVLSASAQAHAHAMSRPASAPRALSLADITREAYIYFGAGASVAWQLAHPAVGRGVAEHGRVTDRPLSRLRWTMAYVYAVTLGTDADRARVTEHVNRAHGAVHGHGYTAFDSVLQLWVAATLYRGAMDMHALFVGPVPEIDREPLYREARAYGTTLQVRDEQWPATADGFDAWWEVQEVRLAVDPLVRDYMHQVLHRASPWFLRPLMPLQRLVTRGLLPARIRALYGMPWSARDERRWQAFRRWAPRLYWTLPRWLRHLPARVVLASLHR